MFAVTGEKSAQQLSAASKSSKPSTSHSVGSGASSGAGSSSGGGYQQTNHVVKRTTPILYSTNRGLHLRVVDESYLTSAGRTDGAYNIKLCDLQRWSTKRANSVNMDETFTTMSRAGAATQLSQQRFSIGSHHSQHLNPNNNSFIPIKQSLAVRFNNTFTRSDEN